MTSANKKSKPSGSRISSFSKMLGFGAATAGGLFCGADADADIVYSGMLNASINVSAPNTNGSDYAGINFRSATNDRIMFALAVTSRTGASSTKFGILSSGVFATTNPGPFGFGYFKVTDTTFGVFNPRLFNTSESVTANQLARATAWMGAANTGLGVFIDPFGAGANGTGSGYVGFSFYNSVNFENESFGWAKIRVSTEDGIPKTFTLVEYAYETTPGKPIHVANRGIPEPTSANMLATLAIGATGLRRYRKRATA